MPNICPYCELESKSKHQLQGHYRICSAVSNNTMPLMHDGITIRKLYDMVQILTKKVGVYTQQKILKLALKLLITLERS